MKVRILKEEIVNRIFDYYQTISQEKIPDFIELEGTVVEEKGCGCEKGKYCGAQIPHSLYAKKLPPEEDTCAKCGAFSGCRHRPDDLPPLPEGLILQDLDSIHGALIEVIRYLRARE